MKSQAKKIVNEESSEGAKMETSQKALIKKVQPVPTAKASGPEGGCKPSGN